jgi:hypothetical protein
VVLIAGTIEGAGVAAGTIEGAGVAEASPDGYNEGSVEGGRNSAVGKKVAPGVGAGVAAVSSTAGVTGVGGFV